MSKKDMKILTNESANVYPSAVVMIYTVHKTVFLVCLRGVLWEWSMMLSQSRSLNPDRNCSEQITILWLTFPQHGSVLKPEYFSEILLIFKKDDHA